MEIVSTKMAPQAIGPYSQAVISGGLVYCSGQIAIEPSSGEFQNLGVTAQTKLVLSNLSAVLAEAGSSMDRVVKTTVYIKDMNDFSLVNAEYALAFGSHTPARGCVEVARLPKDALVEIEAIAEV